MKDESWILINVAICKGYKNEKKEFKEQKKMKIKADNYLDLFEIQEGYGEPLKYFNQFLKNW